MKVTLTINTEEFKRTLLAYMAQSKRSVAEVLNQKAYSILMACSKMAPKADYGKMYSEIGPTSERIVGYKIRIVKKRMTKKEVAGNG